MEVKDDIGADSYFDPEQRRVLSEGADYALGWCEIQILQKTWKFEQKTENRSAKSYRCSDVTK